MKTLTLSVPEISCGHCKASIESAVNPLEGVQRVDVDIAQRTVCVEIDPPADLAQVSAVLSEIGYDVAGIVSES